MEDAVDRALEEAKQLLHSNIYGDNMDNKINNYGGSLVGGPSTATPTQYILSVVNEQIRGFEESEKVLQNLIQQHSFELADLQHALSIARAAQDHHERSLKDVPTAVSSMKPNARG